MVRRGRYLGAASMPFLIESGIVKMSSVLPS